jgi:hypothetical protein
LFREFYRKEAFSIENMMNCKSMALYSYEGVLYSNENH